MSRREEEGEVWGEMGEGEVWGEGGGGRGGPVRTDEQEPIAENSTH